MARLDQLTYLFDENIGLVPNWYGLFRLDGPVVSSPPSVSAVTPSVGSAITRHEAIAFDVTDDGDFRAILLTVSFVGADAPEVIHDGTNFSALYSAGSTKTAIAGGFHFSLLRAGGWPSAPTITPYAFDTTGQENA